MEYKKKAKPEIVQVSDLNVQAPVLMMRAMSLVLLLSQGCCRFRPILFPSWHRSVAFG